VWFALSLCCLLPFLRWSVMEGALLGAVGVLVLLLGAHPVVMRKHIVWSPYQRLEVQPPMSRSVTKARTVTVNTTAYMLLLDLSDQRFEQLQDQASHQERDYTHYDIPYRFKPDAGEVLIVGAGGGNDVAGALRNGAQRVTAVEIDPGIHRIAVRFHPERPYADPRVEVVIDDARSFFKTSPRQFDLISFGLLDAHTSGSTLTNTRIDHYVYTLESFEEARALLKPGGILTVTFASTHRWIRRRLHDLLRQAFGHNPLAFEVQDHPVLGWGGDMFVISDDMDRLRRTVAANPELDAFIRRQELPIEGAPARLTTDDWPYFYLESPQLPMLHALLSAVLLLIFARLKRVLMPPPRRIHWHFFLLGAAFLLLEFQNISKLTLLFGSTWFVSALTITAILVLILAANLVVAKWPGFDVRVAYVGLLATLLALWMIPLSELNVLPHAWKALAAVTLMNLPIGFAGVVFATSFSRTRDPEGALGSNLLGAGLGGLLESLSFLTGIKALLLLVAMLYAASWAARKRMV
jgi:SAM-dependent methyltransferase